MRARPEVVDLEGPHGPKSGIALRLFGAERIADVRAERVAASEAAAVAKALPRVVAAIVRAHAAGAPLTGGDALCRAAGLNKKPCSRHETAPTSTIGK